VSHLALALVGAAVGACARYLVGELLRRQAGTFPWATLVVNVTGSFLLGVLTAAAPAGVLVLLGTGFCGALTTYSTFAYETWRLVEDGAVRLAVGNTLGNVVGSVVAAVAAAGLGMASVAGLAGLAG
jgi:CrcB protein